MNTRKASLILAAALAAALTACGGTTAAEAPADDTTTADTYTPPPAPEPPSEAEQLAAKALACQSITPQVTDKLTELQTFTQGTALSAIDSESPAVIEAAAQQADKLAYEWDALATSAEVCDPLTTEFQDAIVDYAGAVVYIAKALHLFGDGVENGNLAQMMEASDILGIGLSNMQEGTAHMETALAEVQAYTS